MLEQHSEIIVELITVQTGQYREESVSVMVQRESVAAMKDAPNKLSTEVFVSVMVPKSRVATTKDVTIRHGQEELVRSITKAEISQEGLVFSSSPEQLPSSFGEVATSNE